MHSTFRRLSFAAAAVTALLFAGCGPIDAAIDCQSICNRYKTCFDSAYNVETCAARCRTSSAQDADYKRKADTCNACIDERSCTSATFNCAASCGTIIP